MEENVKGTASRKDVLDRRFDSLNDESFIYIRDGYDLFLREADNVSRYLSHAAGWKSDRRQLDFDGFMGCYLSAGEDKVSFMRSGKEVGSVSRGPEGVVLEGFAESRFRNADGSLVDMESLCRDIVSDCVSEANVSEFRDHTAQGHQLMYSLDFGDREVFCVCHKEDLDPLFRFFSGDQRVKFTYEPKFNEVFGGMLNQSGRNAPEDPLPQLRIYLFDGRSIFNESQKVECFGLRREDYERDLEMTGILRDRLMELRSEFEDEVRVLPWERDFSFRHAVHPSLGFRDDVVFLKANGGSDYSTTCFYSSGTPVIERNNERIFIGKGLSIDGFVDMIRDKVMSLENINRAKCDYAAYRQSLSEEQSCGRGRSV